TTTEWTHHNGTSSTHGPLKFPHNRRHFVRRFCSLTNVVLCTVLLLNAFAISSTAAEEFNVDKLLEYSSLVCKIVQYMKNIVRISCVEKCTVENEPYIMYGSYIRGKYIFPKAN